MASLGEPDPQVRRLFDAVAQAQAAALATIREGISASDVDAAARGTSRGSAWPRRLGTGRDMGSG